MTGVVSLLIAATAFSQVSTWIADPAHSHIGFKVRHMMVSNVNGEFKKFDIKVDYDKADVTKSKVNVTIDAASISTDNDRRDSDLRGENFFDVASFPTITYTSTHIRKTGNGLEMMGDLTIHGITKQVILAVDGPIGPITDSRGNIRMGASATGTINRLDFGLTRNSPLEGGGVVIGIEVSLLIDVELIKNQPSEK